VAKPGWRGDSEIFPLTETYRDAVGLTTAKSERDLKDSERSAGEKETKMENIKLRTECVFQVWRQEKQIINLNY
jgi:hypothetical protein